MAKSPSPSRPRLSFSALRLSTRVYLLVAVSMLVLAVTLFVMMRSTAWNSASQGLQQNVQLAVSILKSYEQRVSDWEMEEVSAQAQAAEEIGRLRFGDTGYFWIQNDDLQMVMHPIKPEMNSTDISQIKDAAGLQLFAEIQQTVSRDGQGFVSYVWAVPGTDTIAPKTSYVERFEPWGWTIGTGVYDSELQAQVTQSLMDELPVFVGALLIMALSGLLICRSILRPVGRIIARVQAAAEGDIFSPWPETDAKGGLGILGRSLEKLGATVVSGTRAQEALRNSPANFIITDADHRIVMANSAFKRTLTEHLEALRQRLPDLDPEALTGHSMDLFHQDPAHQRQMLEGLKKPGLFNVDINGVHIAIHAWPVTTEDGTVLGYVSQWIDRTAEKRTEAEISGVVTAAAAGDFTRRLTLEGKTGFFEDVAVGLNSLISGIDTALQETVETVGAIAKGNLSARMSTNHQGSLEHLQHSVNAMAERLGGLVSIIDESTRALEEATNELSTGSADLSNRTEQQASSLEQTAASIEELTSTVRRNADDAKDANRLAGRATGAADEGGAIVQNAVTAMTRIENSSAKITEIISMIDEIAFQTNLLALNAAVEAARAGEAGKGFAVVASEVRTLAQRSSDASKEIKDLITLSNNEVKEGAELVQSTGTGLKSIVEEVRGVAELIGRIAGGSEEQATGLEQISKAVGHLDDIAQQNAALVQESTTALETARQRLSTLREAVSSFTGGGQAALAPTPPPKAPAAPTHRTPAAPTQKGAGKGIAHKPTALAAPAKPAGPIVSPVPSRGMAAPALDEDDWSEF